MPATTVNSAGYLVPEASPAKTPASSRVLSSSRASPPSRAEKRNSAYAARAVNQAEPISTPVVPRFIPIIGTLQKMRQAASPAVTEP